MPTCHSLTLEYATLLEKKREFDAALEEDDLDRALALKAELIEGKTALENKLFVTVEQAETILGKDNVLAEETWEKTYGFRPELPKIPFKRKELEFFARMNEENENTGENFKFLLVFDLDKTNEGIPLDIETMAKLAGENIITNPDGTTSPRLYKDQFDEHGNIKDGAWFKDDKKVTTITPSGKWKIVSDEILPNSTDKNYIKQTNFLITYWRTKIFPILSEEEQTEYEKTFKQWEENTPDINDAIALTGHPVSQLLRESFTGTASRTIALEKTQNKKILQDKYNRSNTPSSDGSIVLFGRLDSSGAGVSRDAPGSEWGSDGVVFSRSEILKRER